MRQFLAIILSISLMFPAVLFAQETDNNEIETPKDEGGFFTFPLKSIYSKIAGYIAGGGDLKGIYKERKNKLIY